MEKKIAIIDCNNFYVSCERLMNPISIGKPTVVLSNNDGCVIARSQEAKDLGIKMGDPYFTQKDFMTKHGFCVYSSNYNLYGDISDRVFSVIKKYSSNVEVYSIDESFVDFSNINFENLKDVLEKIKFEVKRQVGIPVSIGVGPNKTLAKLTSYMAKQDKTYNGLCSFWDIVNFRNLLYSVDVSDVWGIGRKWSKKMKSFGIESVGQFVNTSDGLVQQLTNINGLRTKYELLGSYCFHVQLKPKLKKNLTSSRSFGQDINSLDQISEAMYNYIKSGVKKLNQNKMATTTATIFLSGNTHKDQNHSKTKTITFDKSMNDEIEIWSQISKHLEDMYSNLKTYKKCGVTFHNLVPQNVIQSTLFPSNFEKLTPPINKQKKWEMKQEFKSQKFTTSWNELPLVFS